VSLIIQQKSEFLGEHWNIFVAPMFNVLGIQTRKRLLPMEKGQKIDENLMNTKISEG
jgi:hypothetical protein